MIPRITGIYEMLLRQIIPTFTAKHLNCIEQRPFRCDFV